MFYSVGKALCLWGGQEQRSLRPSQFECKRGPDRYVYVENGSKNCQGVFGKDCWDNKVVTLFHNETAAEWCPVYLLNLYFSKFTKPVAELDFFYLKPLPLKLEMVESVKAWFAAVPIGKNALAKFVVCIGAGIAKKDKP